MNSPNLDASCVEDNVGKLTRHRRHQSQEGGEVEGGTGDGGEIIHLDFAVEVFIVVDYTAYAA